MSDAPPEHAVLDASALRVALIVSRYNPAVTAPMRDAATDAFLSAGGARDRLTTVNAPGAFELPALASAALETHDAAVCLACVVKGETRHDEVIADAAATALAELSARERKPVAFGVLTVDSQEQALARAGGAKGNKGAEAMNAAIETAASLGALRKAGA